MKRLFKAHGPYGFYEAYLLQLLPHYCDRIGQFKLWVEYDSVPWDHYGDVGERYEVYTKRDDDAIPIMEKALVSLASRLMRLLC